MSGSINNWYETGKPSFDRLLEKFADEQYAQAKDKIEGLGLAPTLDEARQLSSMHDELPTALTTQFSNSIKESLISLRSPKKKEPPQNLEYDL